MIQPLEELLDILLLERQPSTVFIATPNESSNERPVARMLFNAARYTHTRSAGLGWTGCNRCKTHACVPVSSPTAPQFTFGLSFASHQTTR